MINNINEINFIDKFSGEDEEVIHPGDAVLGYIVDDETKEPTEKPLVLPLKDRYVHTLIIGPTGCGKTSQSLIPMIHRDMGNLDIGITVLEPKGDLAEKIFHMARYFDREVLYFNPVLYDCPYFNPLYGDETDVVTNITTTFAMLNADSPQFFKDMVDGLLSRGTKLLKRLYGNEATLIDLSTLIWNTNGQGIQMVKEFGRLRNPIPDIQKENEDIFSYFINDYFSSIGGAKGGTKTYEHCSSVRSQISKLLSNKYLRKVLNPPKGRGTDIDFDDAFERGIVITMSTSQGALGDLGRYLGYFLILQLQASIFRRPGREDTRKGNMLFIDEFQEYSNPGFGKVLTMGRSYRVATHLATQARAQIGMGSGKDGQAFIDLVSTNCRNKIIYPGVSYADADYYSKEFGEILTKTQSKSIGKQRFFSSPLDERVTIKEDEKEEVRYSASDIIYRPFGFITCAIIKKNTLQAPVVSKIAYIPKELNDLLDKQIDEYNEIQAQKAEEAEQKIHDMYDDKPSTAENPILEDAVVMDNNNQFKDIISTPDIEDNDIKAKSKNSVVIGDDDYLQGTAFNPNVVDEVEDDFV